MDSDTELTVADATDTRTPPNPTSPRPEANGRRPGPGFGQQIRKYNFNRFLPTRAILGIGFRLQDIGFFLWGRQLVYSGLSIHSSSPISRGHTVSSAIT